MSNAFDKASLVMLPHAYEEGKLYSLKPTDRSGDFTFSRGTDTATRVGPTGLIEKGRENLLTYSNDFSNAAWSKTTTSVTSGQTGYDGSSDAWLLTATTTLNAYMQKTGSFSGVNTFSIYAKANTSSFFVLFDSANPYVYFDLGNGTIGTKVSNPIDAKITSAGNGWYRCSITTNNPNNLRIYVVDADGSTAVTNGNSIYIQDAQLEQGLVARDYLETTTAPVYGGLTDDMPRLDYSGGATCPSLLLEPSRTNLVPYSEYYNGSGYLLETNATLDSTLYESPEGLNNAYKLNLPSTLSRITHSGLYTGAHSFSVWMRADTSGTISLRCATGNPAVSEQKNVTTEWQRFDITATDGNYWQVIRNSGDTLSSVYIYGHQIEAGSYPTSYIPTYGSSQTRAGDLTEASNVSSLIGQTEGTLVVEIDANNFSGLYRFISINNNIINRITLGYNSNNRIFAEIKTNNVTELSYQNSAIPLNQKNKMAIAYKENDCRVFINGEKVYTTNSVLIPANMNQLSLAQGSFKFYGNAHKILTFTNYLSDDEAKALTTL